MGLERKTTMGMVDRGWIRCIDTVYYFFQIFMHVFTNMRKKFWLITEAREGKV